MTVIQPDPVTGQPMQVQTSQQPPAPVFEGTGITPPAQVPPVQVAPQVNMPGLPQAPGQVFTLAQVQEMIGQAQGQARADEKTKLYGRIQELETFQTGMQELAAQQAAEAAAAQQAAEAAAAQQAAAEEAARLEGLSATELSKEALAQINQLQEQLAASEHLRSLEGQLQRVEAYRNDRLRAEADNIHPSYFGYVTGTTNEEIDKSIDAAKRLTEELVNEVSEVTSPQLQELPPQQVAQSFAPAAALEAATYGNFGVQPTGGAPVGPLEGQQTQRMMSPGEVRNMSLTEYSQHRANMLQYATEAYYSQG